MKILKNLAIIPARGGSKRIPKKNIKDFLGKPIIAYSIETSLKSNLFDEVVVSTDDNEIEKIAIQYGATVHKRSQKNADDFATLSDVLVEVIHQYHNLKIEVDSVCCILPTAPFIRTHHLIESQYLFFNKNKDSLIPIVEFSYPVQRSLIISKEGTILFSNPQYTNTRSQDLEKHYHDVGQFYWIKGKVLLKSKSLMTDNTGFYELPSFLVQDIDTEDDWRNAELKYKILHG
ncbi:pseudaminic acid cytidylyltransferase [Namhaeicola litoreus]|uniref:Pseudaminic acid cytidylyltransferase n=1 Tax=Namhaeicola litoreus TaxID=1052145 RepID=A0ABW3Y2J4_9FLAO